MPDAARPLSARQPPLAFRTRARHRCRLPTPRGSQDPNRAYTEAVTRALVDAMIDYSTPMTSVPNSG